MKKLNLNQLSMSWNEKQTPQRAIRYAVMLIMLLTLGVGQICAETRRIYCKCDQSWWYADAAAIGAYYWGSSSLSAATWPGVKMTETSSNSRVWYIDIDDSYTSVIFTRLNPSNSAYWSAKTSDLTISSSNNYYTISSTSGVWDPSKVSGSWSNKTYTITYKDQGDNAYSGSNSASFTTSQKWGYALDLIEGEKDGYVFNGWYTNSSCTGDPITSLGISVNSNQTLYAKWTAETTYTITIANNVNASTSTKSVGATPKTITAPSIDDYAFSTWSAMPSGVTRTSGNLTDASISISATNAATVTANFNLIPVKLYKMSAAKDGTSTDKGAMSYDATSGAYYKEITTDASPYYFRFYYNGSTDYSSDWEGSEVYNSGQAVTANGSKITCQSLAGWGNKPNMYYVGESGTTIKIWYDHQNGKTWITADKDKEYVLRGAKADAPSVLDGMPGWNTITSYFDGLASGNTGTISCTLNASEWYHLKAYNVYTKTWWGPDSNTGLSDGELSTATSGGSGNFYFQSTIAGSYTFTLDKSSGIKMKVDYPVSYTLTYDIGTVKGNDGSISTSPSTSSGSYVPSGNTVTLTAPDAAEGYTWKGWYGNAAGTGDQLEDEQEYEVTMNADKTLYACYTEDMHTVTVTAGTHGSITTPASGTPRTVSAGISTSASIAATAADYGYVFQEWTVEEGDATFASSTSASTTVNATSDATIQANFVSHWTIAGGNSTSSDGPDAMGDWNEKANGIDNWDNSTGDYIGYVDIDLPANTLFYFKVRDLLNTNWYGNIGEMTYTDHTDWVMSKDESTNCRITTAGKGTYRFTWNEDDKQLTVTYPTSYTVTYNVSTFYNEDASHDYDNTTGGTISYVKDNDSIALTSGKYVVSGGTVTFKATPATGYTFAGWYSNKECTTAYSSGSGVSIVDGKLTLTIGANKTVYAKFEEKMTTVKIMYTKIDDFYGETCGWVKVGGVTQEPNSTVKVGVHTTVTLRAEADSTSHYYGGWSYFNHEDYEKTDSVGADYHSELTIRGKGAGDDYQSIYVSFPQLEKIYFKNWNDDTKTQLWDSVYVGFNPNHDGLGANVWGKSADDVRTMQRVSEDTYHYVRGEYDYYCMWWSYVPRHMTRTGDKNVVFFNKGVMRSYDHFAHGCAADRGDYNSKNNMFVPASTKKETINEDCDYYSNGYWRNYWALANRGQGYYLQQKTGTNTYTELGEFVASKGTTYENEYLTEMEYTIRLDNTTDKYYRIVSAGGEHYVANAAISSGSPESYLKSNNEDDACFTLKPTAEGNYTFTIIQSSDTMDISVDFPVAVGDYVLENTYNDGSAKTTRSDIIKAAKAADKKRYSMYLNPAGSGTLKLRKCTAITDGVPTWSEGDATNLAAVLTAVGSTPGVYQFDLTVDKTNNCVSAVDSLRLYTGNYYIKVDAAPGGWAAYTENVMDKNTVSFDRTKDYTFDNYWCKYYGKGTGHTANIKCVVANDYCNQLSDTLKQDKLSLAWMSGGEPYLSKDSTSVRFSYNSATNTINRAYLAASLDNYYLDLKVYNSAKVYKTDGTSDLYTESYDGTWAANCRFDDTNDWVYEKLVKVNPGGKAGVVAKYQGVQQTFLPDTTTLLGGETQIEKYTIRLVYDFKTNYMMTAFVLDGSTINYDLSDFDMLWVRHKDNSAAQLTLKAGKSLTNVRPIGAIEFRYDSVHYAGTGDDHVDLSSWNNTGARQYLKYFVSFPFDVELNSIFGLNQARYGRYDHYVIQKYDGATRAKEGLFYGDGDNYWVDLEPGDTLHANEGYCVIFDNDYVRGTWGSMWENKTHGDKVYLYFPAIEEIASITNSNTTTTVSPQTCTSTRSWTTASGKTKYHSVTDSHWSLIGNPLFHDAYIKDFTNGGDSTLKSYYYMDLTSTFALQDWQPADITKGTTQLNAMSSVLVQWYGTINWGTSAGALSAPKRNLNENKNYAAELQISYNGIKADQTFVHLEEGANEGFELREDMCKVLVKARPNIYTFIGEYDVAYNEMPIANCTIPVGILARKNGTYTFSMPSNFSGTVTLIDTYTQTRTNLNLEDYEVYLEKGTIDERFLLEININNAPTAIDGVTDGSGTLKDGKAHKFIMDGVMYILQNGALYDAQGRRVK